MSVPMLASAGNIGEFLLSDGPLHAKFNSTADGLPSTLESVIPIVYRSDGASSDLGVTVTPDFASLTGLTDVAIDFTADPSFYAEGMTYQFILQEAKIDSQAVSGACPFHFSIKNRRALAPSELPPQPSLVSTYLGDLPRQGEHFFYKFHTLLNGQPASLTGVTLEIYKDGDLPVDSPDGVSIITDFGSVTGLNQIDFDLSAPLYTDHANYTVGFAAGMLGGSLNMTGITIASFSILQRMCRINWAAIDRSTPS